MTSRRGLLQMATLAWMLVQVSPARAGGFDHDLARRAVEAGEAKPLAEILPLVRERLPGEVVGIEFERRGDAWVYEFKVVDPAGRKTEIYVNALTGNVLQVKDRGSHGKRH